jgi:hypothetical protein
VGGACGTNGGEKERVPVIGRKGRGKEITRDLLEIGLSVWTGLVWLWIATGGEVL